MSQMLSSSADSQPDGAAGVRVCVLGQHRVDYPRNACIQAWLAAAGFEVNLCHSRIAAPWRTLSLLQQYLQVWRRTDVVFATEGSHTHIPYLKLLTALTNRPLIFDPFLSRYNTRIEDRKLHPVGSFQAFRAKMHDSLACRAADALVFDTREHLEYFAARYSCDKPCYVLEVGVDEALFRPRKSCKAPGDRIEVLFYGTYIPLHGIDTILHAADELRDESEIRFRLIGSGQTHTEMRALSRRLGLANVEFLDSVPEAELVEHIARADICLGVFADGTKPSQVVPNKVVQCAAMQKAMVTRASPAVERYFSDGESVTLVEKANPLALAASIRSLAQDSERRARLAQGARHVYEARFSQSEQVCKLRKLVLEVRDRRA